MKAVTTIFVILAFFIKSFSSSLVLLDYVMNKHAYELKCCNKANPKLKCHGRCQMMKKLQEEEKKEKQEQEKNSEIKTEPLSSRSFFASVHLPEITGINTGTLLLSKSGKTVQRSADIFHPPKNNCPPFS